jgi:RNA polymerase sigma factor (sigma-70 family)
MACKSRIYVPHEIEVIFEKPGRDWSLSERSKVIEWLNEKQLKFLLYFGLLHLGSANAQDAENAWQDFEEKKLNDRIDRYDPAKGLHFWNWLLLCFKQDCWKVEGKKRREGIRQITIKDASEGEDDSTPGLELVDTTDDPEKALGRKQERMAVWDEVKKLPPTYFQVIKMYYFDEMQVPEISKQLGISESLVKIRLHRARQELFKGLVTRCIEVEMLSAPYLQVIKMYYFDKTQVPEISKQLGESEANVNDRLYRARRKIRELWLSKGKSDIKSLENSFSIYGGKRYEIS